MRIACRIAYSVAVACKLDISCRVDSRSAHPDSSHRRPVTAVPDMVRFVNHLEIDIEHDPALGFAAGRELLTVFNGVSPHWPGRTRHHIFVKDPHEQVVLLENRKRSAFSAAGERAEPAHALPFTLRAFKCFSSLVSEPRDASSGKIAKPAAKTTKLGRAELKARVLRCTAPKRGAFGPGETETTNLGVRVPLRDWTSDVCRCVVAVNGRDVAL